MLICLLASSRWTRGTSQSYSLSRSSPPELITLASGTPQDPDLGLCFPADRPPAQSSGLAFPSSGPCQDFLSQARLPSPDYYWLVSKLLSRPHPGPSQPLPPATCWRMAHFRTFLFTNRHNPHLLGNLHPEHTRSTEQRK